MADIIHYKASCDIFINYKCSVIQKQNMGIFLGKLRTGVQTESGPKSRRIALHLSRKRGDAVSAAWFCHFSFSKNKLEVSHILEPTPMILIGSVHCR